MPWCLPRRGCRGAAFAGAVAEAASWGVNFVGLAGASAGSIVAALLAAGAAPRAHGNSRSTHFKTFLIPAERLPQKPPLTAQILSPLANRVWRGAGDLMLHRGSHSSRQIDTWLNAKLKELLPKIKELRVQFKHLPKPVWIVAANLISRRVEVWSQDKTPTAEVAHAVRCSCTIPILFQPVDGRFVDGALLSNLPTFVFSDRQRNVFARRILTFTLHSDASNKTSTSPPRVSLL